MFKNLWKNFTIAEFKERTEHEGNCNFQDSSSSITLQQVLALTPTKNISRDIEDAALHVVKQKMAKAKSNTVEFKSGGPRVSY